MQEPIAADNISGMTTPIVKLTRTGADLGHHFKSGLIVNPGPLGPIVSQPYGLGVPEHGLFDGLVTIGCYASNCPLGAYGNDQAYFDINQHGGLTTFANSPSIAAGGGFKVPFNPPYVGVTSSQTGGTFASGLVCWMVVGVDSGGNEGLAGADTCANLSGPIASADIHFGNAVPGAASYKIFRRIGGPIEDQITGSTQTVYFTSATLPFTDTGAAGTAGLPLQLEPNPWYVAATDQLNPNGPGWVGKGGPFGIGMIPVGGVAGDLQAAGKISAANWPLAASATLTYTAIAAQTCQEQSVTVTGAASTGVASASPTADLGSVNLSWSAWVSAANTVSVRVCNPSAGSITPSAVTWQARVIQ